MGIPVNDLQPIRTGRRRWPVPPSLLIGLAPLVAFAGVSAWRSRPSDDYPELGLTVDSVVRALVVPEAIALAVMVVLTTALGWWPLVMTDPRRGWPTWAVIAPVAVLAVSLGRLPVVDWSAQSTRYFLLLALGTLLVGCFEELMTRGVLLVGLRRRLPEFWVWVASCVLFGLLHLLNVLAGAALGTTVLQVVFAMSFGSTLYLARRFSRTLVVPVLLHGLWDFGSIGVQATGLDPDALFGGRAGWRAMLVVLLALFTILALVFGVVAGAVVAWRDDRRRHLRRRWRGVPTLGAFTLRQPEQGLPADQPGGPVPVP